MIKKYGLVLIFVQALIAMVMSLYYGFYGDIVANILDWDLFNPDKALTASSLWLYARTCMYPIVLIAAVWLWKKAQDVVDYILPLAVLWFCIELYHVTYGAIGVIPQVSYFWWLTIPWMCLIAFVVIILVSILIKKAH
jgi:disulfide bond formation protein DsbB